MKRIRALDIDDLLTVYLDGFASGILTMQVNAGVPNEKAWEFAQSAVVQVMNDPAITETMRGKIRDRLDGRDQGPQFLRTVDGS